MKKSNLKFEGKRSNCKNSSLLVVPGLAKT